MRTLAYTSAFLAALGLTPSGAAAAPPLPAPPEFAQPQSPPKPEPFPVKYVDQGQFDPRLKGTALPEGFKAEIVIDAPDAINPVGMTFDPQGNLYVMEWCPDAVTGGKWFEVKETFRYKDGTTRQVATMKKFTTDLIKVFRYNAGTGLFDKPQTIIAEELPSSILWHEGYLYVTGRGTVRRWKQSRPNGPWDVRETVAQGFCGFHHHQVSGLTIGNDGLLYITSGDDDNVVEGSDGSRTTVLRTGAVFRCRPDGSKMETFSQGYRNPYRDIAYDDRFNFFHSDNDNEDGSKFMGCRIMHVAEGTDFGWRLALGARCCRPDNVRGAIAGELPGKVAPMIKTGRGSPAGLLIYHDTHVPEPYRGLLYYPDVFRKLVRAYKVAPDGSTFKITNELEFMKSDDPLFRPCQMVTGPDGAMYVCDWRTNSGGAGKLSGDGVNGRIYRVTWTGTKDSPAFPRRGMDSWAKITKLTDVELLKTLAAPDLTDRVLARKELVRRGPAARDLVLKKFVSGGLDGNARLVAIGVLTASWGPDVEDLFRLLVNDEAADVRRLALEGMAYHAKPKDGRVYEALVKALADHDPAVRRAAALGIGRLGHDGSGETLVNSLRHDADADAYLKDAYVRGIEKLGKPGIDALLALAQSGNDKDKDLAVAVFLGLRTRPAADAIPELMLHPHVTADQREALIRSYSNYQTDPPVSLEPLAEYLAKRPNEPVPVLLAAVDTFTASGDALAPKATQIVLNLLDRPDESTRISAIIGIESARLAAAAPKLTEFITDPSRTQVERVAAVKALRVLGAKSAVEPIKTVLAGQHPAALKAEVLRTLAALDIATARAAAEPLLDQPDPQLLAEAVAVLTATKTGTKLVGERYRAKKLPRDFFPQVNDALNKFADDPALAGLRADVLRGGLLLSLEPSQVDRVRTEVSKKGNPQRGKELYLNTKLLACASCHRMEGVGGIVGPDLTRLWDTMTVEKILESVVDPSKEIKEGFQTYRLTTADGQVFTGLKVKEDAKEVIVRDSNGRDHRVARDEVEALTPSKLSLMPDNVASQLSYDQFIDLLAFLKSKKEQESLRGLVVDATAAGPFPNTARPLNAISAGEWKPRAAGANGTFAVQPASSGGPEVTFLRAYVFAPKRQKATVAIESDTPWSVSVNGSDLVPKPESETELKEGWNVLVVKVAHGLKPATLSVRVNCEGVRTASKPDTAPVANAGTGGR
ncbi:PVC-type heme-binding CxxCH protein [Frigoriglobus tundricola]|uniref:Beta-propeller-type glycoside hydrolase n=1 Tax=Frigoriglobus tundricola TaxID=2774151 RepID=A0A6M5YK60_9BACT|nr:PVC-type heme-binding CxxCH protein [Frigoriglobus tundricola]QJW93691.1 beta-propeller-type glycoside hydrolase [Frigoriglobus tundricola]